MAQTGYSPILIYGSTTTGNTPAAGNLTTGTSGVELAINATDGKLFYKDNAGVVQTLATKAATSGTYTSITLSGGTANGVAYLNSSKVVTTGSALTFDGTNLGVGTASPNQLLDVRGANGVGIRFLETTTGNTNRIQLGTGSGYGYIDATAGAGSTALAFQVASSEQMRLTSTGLGIGTSSPAYKLDVNSGASTTVARLTSTGTSAYLGLTNSGATTYIGNDSTSGSFIIQTPASSFSTKLTLDNTGNLGLGVTPSAWYSTYKALQISSNGSFSTNTDFFATGNNYYADATATEKFLGSGYALKHRTVSSSGKYEWYVSTASGTAGNAITFTQAMTLDASGRLSVATTNPTGGGFNPTIAAKALADNIGGGIMVEGSGADATLNMGYDGASMFLSSSYRASAGYKPIAFYTSGTERARIDSSGNFLVNTTVTSSSNLTGFAARPYAGGIFLEVCHSTSASSGDSYVDFRRNGTVIGSISQNGTTGVLYNITSDYRLKDVVGAVIGSGERIDALKPIDYTWKADGAAARGFLAHEFQTVYANSVTGTKDAVDDEGNPVYQQMQASTTEVIADLVAELQSLRKRVAQLEGK